MPCPVGSGREMGMNPNMCVCSGNSTTPTEETTTMSANCTGAVLVCTLYVNFVVPSRLSFLSRNNRTCAW